MTEQTPRVSIIIPCRNEAQHIGACLNSVLRQAEPPGGFEVVVADGMSNDGTREKIAEFARRDPRVRMVDNRAQTTAPGLNRAILAARGEIVVRIDAHTEYAPDYVRQCIAVMEATGADNVGGAARTQAEGRMQRAICAAYHSPFSTGGAGFHQCDFEGEVDTVVYGCWRRERLVELGMFDEQLVRNQDDELNFRLKQAGGRLWQSRAIRSWYRPRASLQALFRQYLQYGYWKVDVLRKHGRPTTLRQLAPVLFVASVVFGLALAPLHPWLLAAYVVGLACYGLASVLFSMRAAAAAGLDLLPLLPLVFAVFHVSYGIGFALGLVDFILLRRAGRGFMTRLTRN